MWADLRRVLGDWLAALRLRREVTRWRARSYEDCVETVQGLRRAMETQRRVQGDLRQQLAVRDVQAANLRAEYAALQNHLASAESATAKTERLALFRQLQPVLVQLPTMRAAVESGADLTARDVLELLAPLDQLVEDLGLACIGEAGQETTYDPRLHRAVGRGAGSTQPGDRVGVRYVGFGLDGEVIAKAEVTRLAPGGGANE